MRAATRNLLTTATLFALLTIALVLVAPNADARVITFDAPGAGTGANQGTGCFGCNFGINNWGAIAGTYLDANNVFHGFLRSPEGRFTTFEAPGADTTPNSYNGTYAENINDLGEITGNYADATGTAHGFVRSPSGTFTTFDVPGGVGGSNPLFVSLDGIVAGYMFDVNGLPHAFLRYPNGAFAVFGGPGSCTANIPGCLGSAATYASLVGGSVGAFMDDNLAGHGMIRSPLGKFTLFNAPGAGSGAYQGTGCPGCILGVNVTGAIAGSYTDANNVFHGFLRSPEGEITTFDAPGAGTDSYEGTGCFSDCAVGLNDWGMITGSYWDSNDVHHGFLRFPEGSFVTVDPPGSQGTQPASINNAGAVTGFYVDANGVMHGFLLTP